MLTSIKKYSSKNCFTFYGNKNKKLNNKKEANREEDVLINLKEKLKEKFDGKNKKYLPDNEWVFLFFYIFGILILQFATLFLRSFKNERQLKWWKFPIQTKQEDFQIVWFFYFLFK